MAASIRLSLAVDDYDHVRDLTSGKVAPKGIELVPVDLPASQIFRRTVTNGDFDVAEISLGMYLEHYSRGLDTFTAIPVFPSRVFRHSSIYVHRDGGISKPEDLAGKRIGVPRWSQTASIYGRGLLAHEYGVGLKDVEWVHAGVNAAVRNDTSTLPLGLWITTIADDTLDKMLLERKIDAVISGFEPAAFVDGDPRIVRLFADYPKVEAAYFRATHIFPIQHTVLVRTSLLNATPWIAHSLYNAFDEAKRRGLRRVLDRVTQRFAMPWHGYYGQEVAQIFGDDPFPYGIEPNRPTLEAFFRDSYEQGVISRRMPIEEIFARQFRSG